MGDLPVSQVVRFYIILPSYISIIRQNFKTLKLYKTMIKILNPTMRENNPAFKTYLRAMKLSVILCFLGMLQVSASVYSQ
jgi:hypothetical protein